METKERLRIYREVQVNPFLLFAGVWNLSTAGGWNDFQAAYSTELEALAAAQSGPWDWYQVVNRETLEVVREG